jgi:hypothetical protein
MTAIAQRVKVNPHWMKSAQLGERGSACVEVLVLECFMAGNLIAIKDVTFSFQAKSQSPQSDKGTLSMPEKL